MKYLIDGERIVKLIIKNAFTGKIRTIDKDFKISNEKRSLFSLKI